MVATAQKAQALEARLAGLALPASGGWLTLARGAARKRLQAMGLPGRRDEYWRWTDPATLIAAEVAPAAVFDAGDEAPVFDSIDRVKLVFVDGVFDSAASDNLAEAGVEITRLADGGAADGHWAREIYGVLEARGQSPVERPLAALNTGYATDGVLIRVAGRAPKPINLIYLHKSDVSDAMLHLCVKVEAGAELTLLENGPAAARFNMVLEVEVADGGAFHHIRAQGREHARCAVTHIFAHLGANSLFKSFTLTANGVMTRNEAVIELTGDDSVAHIAGAAMGDGDFHLDDTVFVTHDAQRCESRQVFKKVLMNGAQGVFQGKILVKADAQKTNGYQISQALLLDDDSSFQAKPELEIHADDVQCSHGSTTGAIDDTVLFYLRSRGVPEREAQALMVLAFMAAAIDEIDSPAIAEDIRARLEAWLFCRLG